ncbi:DUF726-domain-containing protein [Abortiporus biennis]|nr:DUF726-domain-containing protein [Abortiporus biennis]
MVAAIAPIESSIFDDEEGWQDMPIVRDSDDAPLDEEDRKKYHYVAPTKKDDAVKGAGNAIGSVEDIDFEGNEWRTKAEHNESEYTRLRLTEEDESDEVHLRTRYLFNEDVAMTPLSQMQATKDLLTEAQRIAYVGLCALTAKEMASKLKAVNQKKELNAAIKDMELWSLKIMGRLYYHMELATEEQKMIESLSMHGIEAKDLVPPLMTTHTVANPEYDPAEARRQAEEKEAAEAERFAHLEDELEDDTADIAEVEETSTPPATSQTSPEPDKPRIQTTTRVLEDTSTKVEGVSTHLSAADENVTLDIRWTVLCDLFLVLIADSVYDARSRVLLENVALKLGLGWLDLVKFERRVTEALEIQEEVNNLEQKDVIEDVKKATRRRRYMMLGLATLGGGLVIGLSAGLLAPVIGAGLGAAFTTIGITGTTSFLAGAGGAAVITTGGVLTGSGIAVNGMANRTKYVRTFDLLPLHNNKRVNCILTVPGFMNGDNDDVRLPFSVLDPVVGDVFSVLWEPEMIKETGSALKILTAEVLTQIGQTVLAATVMTALMSALQWPIILTKLGYLIDNPWSNALDRAKSAGKILADVLLKRHLGVRPITLIGFSLGSRVIYYALVELAKQKAYGVVQDVFLLGATVTANRKTWIQVRSVVSGRFVNAYARNDWVLNYLFRATSGGVGTVAGLRPVMDVPGLENVDVTDKIAGHMSYRTFMPLILDQLGFPVSADYFNEPEEPDFEGDRVVIREGEENNKKKSWFSRKKKSNPSMSQVSRPPSSATFGHHRKTSSTSTGDDDLPPREVGSPSTAQSTRTNTPTPGTPSGDIPDQARCPSTPDLPIHAGFDFRAIKEVLGNTDLKAEEMKMPSPHPFHVPTIPPPTQRSESAPPPVPETPSPERTPTSRLSMDLPPLPENVEPIAGPSNSRHDLNSSFSRSLSLNNIRAEPEDVTSLGPAENGSFSSTSTLTERAPTLSFGTSDGSLWPAPSEASDPFSNFHDRSLSSFSRPNDPFKSNNPFIPSTLSNNSFVTPEPAGLSFGGVDGSITFSPVTRPERDPWNLPTPYGTNSAGKKSASTLNLNPWDS